ncbi:hypothetical protein AAG570_013987 [Ranatra chinensis]|uniref:Uncharacterized protein n=1 Tax=Ranatra chinensis TaxID=642074 RepID=A0ABD0YDS4_9HEMI
MIVVDVSHEDELVGSYKQRIETLQEERLADLKQLGEFHKLALEQVSNLTVYYPNARSGIKLPLRLPGKPSTEEELTEREKALIEKERQLQVKEAELVIQKEDLDHEKQKERTKWEEKERELKRARSETRLKEEFHSNELTYEKKHLQIIKAEIERMKEIVVKEQAELTLEKLSLAAEKAKLETVLKLQQSGNQNMSNYDLLQAQAELQAALSVAKEAQEAALAERRKMEQTRQDLEAITWQQQAKDQQLDNREKHIMNILQESEVKREEGLKFFEEARRMKTEVLEKQEELQGLISKIEMKEKEMAKERMELAKEKIELDRRKVQLDLVLPELTPAESLVINPPRNTGLGISHTNSYDTLGEDETSNLSEVRTQPIEATIIKEINTIIPSSALMDTQGT